MKDIFKVLIFILLFSFLIGCTTYIPLNVESDPPGANIYIDGEFKGVTPRLIYHKYDPNIHPLDVIHQKTMRVTKRGYKSKEIAISILDGNFSKNKKIILEKQQGGY